MPDSGHRRGRAAAALSRCARAPLPDDADPARIAFTDYVSHPARHPLSAASGLCPCRWPHAYHALSRETRRYQRAEAISAARHRELTAEDYVYAIKRLAHPRLHSPIFGLMEEYIVGLGDFASRLRRKRTSRGSTCAPMLEGVGGIDRHRYRIRVKGKYPQFLYWLAMPFFAPMPWEADSFTVSPGMAEKNLTLDWYPVGTGPYMLTENNPNARMVLERNPNFRRETYPCEGRGRRQGRRPAEGLRPGAAFHRQSGVHPREGADSLLEQVPPGLL
jgi:oligopeptide transport system substrate-binding protein